MNKLLTAILAAAFAASPVYAQTTAAPAKDEKKAEAKKEAAPAKAEAKKDAAPAKTEAKKEEKKKPKGGC
jgi:Ni/Co efflux regulator RcnB